MGLSCKKELYGMFRIVDYLAETIKVGEEQMRTLVCGKTTAEANDKRIGVDTLQQADYTRRITLVLQPSITELQTDIIHQFLLQSHTSRPYLFIGHIVDGLPNLLVRLVGHELLVEVFGIQLTPFCSRPCGEVDTVSHISHMILFRIITLPNRGEHLLTDPAMKFRNAIDLLASVASKRGHAELLAFVIGIRASHSNELIPRDTKFLRIATHVFPKQAFIKIVVASRNWSVHRIQTTCTNQLKCLIERQSLLDIVTKTLQIAKGGMSLIAMIDVFLDAKFLEQKHATDTKQYLLLQAVLPISSIERVGDRLVKVGVHLVVGVKKIEFHTTHIHTPNVCMNLIVGIRNINDDRISVLIELALNRKSAEILCLVIGYLLAIH